MFHLQTSRSPARESRAAIAVRQHWRQGLAVAMLLLLLLSLVAMAAPRSVAADAPLQSGNSVRFAVIGDHGGASRGSEDVANLVKGWNPDFVVTTGDNQYAGETTFDEAVGQFYCDFLKDAGSGDYCDGGNATKNAFFPSLGNHDSISEYTQYFTLPGVDFTSSSNNERYYDFVWGPVHFFILNTENEPDGHSSNSRQGQWLRNQLARSDAKWNLVVFHRAAYSSGPHGSTSWMQWPFEDWGADAVLNGHDHDYERLQIGNIPYFVNGLGGNNIYGFDDILPQSRARYNGDFGAMLVEANETSITYKFINRSGTVIDTYTYPPSSPTATPTSVPPTATPTSVPPTATPTSVPPTATPTSVPPTATPTSVPPTATPTNTPPPPPTPTPPPGPGTVEVRIVESSDDVEEDQFSGFLNTISSDLELGDQADFFDFSIWRDFNGGDGFFDFFGGQKVGLRFQNVQIPQGATITSAYIEFTVDESTSDATNVTIRGQDADDAEPFSIWISYDLSDRPLTDAAVEWDIPVWSVVGETHQSPDISAVVQEIVNRSGWSAGASMVFSIEGEGRRVAESYDGDPEAAPLLHVTYTTQ